MLLICRWWESDLACVFMSACLRWCRRRHSSLQAVRLTCVCVFAPEQGTNIQSIYSFPWVCFWIGYCVWHRAKSHAKLIFGRFTSFLCFTRMIDFGKEKKTCIYYTLIWIICAWSMYMEMCLLLCVCVWWIGKLADAKAYRVIYWKIVNARQYTTSVRP